jgi:hypothetical protein
MTEHIINCRNIQKTNSFTTAVQMHIDSLKNIKFDEPRWCRYQSDLNCLLYLQKLHVGSVSQACTMQGVLQEWQP